MLEVGRFCVKLVGRDAGKEGIIIKVLDNSYVLVDGNLRRKKVNINHLEPLNIKVNIKEDLKTEEVLKLLEEKGFKISKNLNSNKKKTSSNNKKSEKENSKNKE